MWEPKVFEELLCKNLIGFGKSEWWVPLKIFVYSLVNLPCILSLIISCLHMANKGEFTVNI